MKTNSMPSNDCQYNVVRRSLTVFSTKILIEIVGERLVA